MSGYDEEEKNAEYVDTIRASLDQNDTLVQFLLNIEETIDRLDHEWKGEILDRKGNWIVPQGSKPIMADTTRNKLISFLHSQLNRGTFFTYYAEENDIIKGPIWTFCSSFCGVLAAEWYNGNIYVDVQELYLIRDKIEYNIRNAYQQAIGGGTRVSIRQSARIIESTKHGEKEDRKKKFGIF